jgi:hypothetical protein
MGKARDLARLSPNSSGQLPDANLLALAANKLSGVIPDANAPSGSVIQVVQTFKSDTSVIGSASFVDLTGLVATITPISTSSKILVLVSVQATAYFTTVQLRLTRNGTDVGVANSSGRVSTLMGAHYPASDENHQNNPFTSSFLDSPSSTSLLTYKVQIKTQDGRNAYINRSGNDADNSNWSMRSTSNITLLEIAQ